MEKDDGKKAESVKTAIEKTEKFLGCLSVMANEDEGGFLVGNSFTWIDFVVTHLIKNFENMLKVDLSSKYPVMNAVFENVLNEPKIKEWVGKRPVTPY